MVVYIIIKDVAKTKIMQHFGVFEKFKFVGIVMKWQSEEEIFLSANQAWERLKYDDANFVTVGIIIPNVGHHIIPEHTVMSTGKDWITIEDLIDDLT